MAIKLNKGYSKYGASMGRTAYHAAYPSGITVRLSLTHVPLSGDYDNGGAYWGAGAPLYRCADDSGDAPEPIEFFLRAASRDDAKAKVRALGYVNARFYR